MARTERPRLSLATAQAALDRCDGWCECGCGRRATEWHHVFGQRAYPELVDNVDNIVAVATACHTAHTNASRRFSRSICWRAEGLAVTPAMENYLERYYPPPLFRTSEHLEES